MLITTRSYPIGIHTYGKYGFTSLCAVLHKLVCQVFWAQHKDDATTSGSSGSKRISKYEGSRSKSFSTIVEISTKGCNTVPPSWSSVSESELQRTSNQLRESFHILSAPAASEESLLAHCYPYELYASMPPCICVHLLQILCTSR